MIKETEIQIADTIKEICGLLDVKMILKKEIATTNTGILNTARTKLFYSLAQTDARLFEYDKKRIELAKLWLRIKTRLKNKDDEDEPKKTIKEELSLLHLIIIFYLLSKNKPYSAFLAMSCGALGLLLLIDDAESEFIFESKADVKNSINIKTSQVKRVSQK